MLNEIAEYLVLAVAFLIVYCPVVLACMFVDWILRKYGYVSKEQKINGFLVGNFLFIFIAPMVFNMNM